MAMKKKNMQRKLSRVDFVDEDGRQDIFHWSEKREKKYQGFRKSLHAFQIFAFNMHLLRSFLEHFNFMVLIQMTLAVVFTYICKSRDISYDVHVSLFISPIVFPLAFSINTDFQRKEKVLEDLANFKASAMMWFFCMRDWREACAVDLEYIKVTRNKIKGIMFHLREYLLTEKIDRRKFIVRVIYEDLSDANQLNEKVRVSSMPANSPLVSRIIHFVYMMCLSFERLRVIREYRSPRSIRSFTKVLIFVLPLLLSPYYIYLGTKGTEEGTDDKPNNWSAYYISVMVAFVFGALQGVQDKLDDPFDGMSEDDINLDTLDEWTLQSLEATCHRSYKIGRFQVVSYTESKEKQPQTGNPYIDTRHSFPNMPSRFNNTNLQQPSFANNSGNIPNVPLYGRMRSRGQSIKVDELELHPYAGVLNNIQGNTTILRGGHTKVQNQSFNDLASLERQHDSLLFNQSLGVDQTEQVTLNASSTMPYLENENENISSLFPLLGVEIIDKPVQQLSVKIPAASLDVSGSEASTYGVASYLASQKRNSCSSNLTTFRRQNSAPLLISRRSSRSSYSFTPECFNDYANSNLYNGDELTNKTPKYQSSTKSLLKELTNDRCNFLNPSLFDKDSEVDIDKDDNVDKDLENIKYQSNPKPRFKMTTNGTSPGIETLLFSMHQDTEDDNDDDDSDESLKSTNLQGSPKSRFKVTSNVNTAGINASLLNTNKNSQDDNEDEHEHESDDESLPIELCDTPLFDNSQWHPIPSFDNSQHTTSIKLDDTKNSNSTLLFDNNHLNNSPLFDKIEMTDIPIINNLSPKPTSRFIINKIDKNNVNVDDVITGNEITEEKMLSELQPEEVYFNYM